MYLFDDKSKMADVEACVAALPAVEFKAEAFVEDSETILTTDAVTIRCTVRYPNLTADQVPGYVHGPQFDFLKKQTWHFVISDQSGEKVIVHQPIATKPLDFALNL